MVKCKFCQSEIDEKAKVCPVCRRDLRWQNNKALLIPIVIISLFLIISICLSIYFVVSPNAPLKVRRAVCEMGIRSGCPYCCYYKLEE